MKTLTLFALGLLVTKLAFAQMGDSSLQVTDPSFSSFTPDFTLLADSPILQVFDFPSDVPILDSGCILTNDSLTMVGSQADQEVFFAGCRNQEYCEQQGLEGSKKWICGPAGAGQTSKCFQCK